MLLKYGLYFAAILDARQTFLKYLVTIELAQDFHFQAAV